MLNGISARGDSDSTLKIRYILEIAPFTHYNALTVAMLVCEEKSAALSARTLACSESPNANMKWSDETCDAALETASLA